MEGARGKVDSEGGFYYEVPNHEVGEPCMLLLFDSNILNYVFSPPNHPKPQRALMQNSRFHGSWHPSSAFFGGS